MEKSRGPLTHRTKQLIALVGDASLQSKMMKLFEEDGALYGPPTTDVLERVRFAVIKLAMSKGSTFDLAARLYRIDTRDLLLEAEFEDPRAHQQWCDAMLKDSDD
jgi:hypothetical protein